MKKIFSFIIFTSLLFHVFGKSNDTKTKFIKGNISDKTNALKESTGEDTAWLSEKAIIYALENKEFLGNDRDLDALVVSAILTITPEYISSIDNLQKSDLLLYFTKIFQTFSTSNTVQLSVLSKVLLLKDSISTTNFTKELNDFLLKSSPTSTDLSLLKSIITTLESIGNNQSFNILFSKYINDDFSYVKPELESALIKLAPLNEEEILHIINENDINKNNQLFTKIIKKSKISNNFVCEIAENLLNSSIIYIDTSLSNKDDLTALQIEALQVLSSNNWTRASTSGVSYFTFAKEEFKNSIITEENMIFIISALVNISPIESISPLVAYLGELNSQKEMGMDVSIPVTEAVIKTLGAIGNKSAFDSLLAVTYLDYPESVLSAAREALAGLKW